MSEDPADRLLDYALEKLLHEEEEPDLSAEVTDAWRRGERGSYRRPGPLRAVPAAAEDPAVPPAFRQPELVAAAALFLAFLALTMVWLGDSDSPPGLALAGEATCIDQVTGSSRVGSDVRPGEILLVGQGAVRLELPDGGELRAEPGARLRLRTRYDVELLQGAFTVETRQTSLELRALGCVVAPRADSLVSLRVSFQHGGPDDWLDLIEPGDRRRDLRLSVLRGEIRGSDPSGAPLVLGADSFPWNVSLPTTDPVGEERLHELAEMLFFDLGGLWMGVEYEKLEPQRRELATLLRERPGLWGTLGAITAKHRRAPQSSWERLLDFLQGQTSDPARELVRELWLEVPEAFWDAVLVTWAERGVLEFEEELVALLELYEGESPAPVTAAAWAALQGDRRGEPILRAAWGEPGTKGNRDLALLAAFSLDHLDQGASWERARKDVRARVLDSLENYEVLLATDLVLALEFFEQRFELPGDVKVGTLLEDLRQHRFRRRNTIQGEGAVRALLDQLVPG